MKKSVLACWMILIVLPKLSSSQTSVINACSIMAEKAFRTYTNYKSNSAMLASAYSDYCSVASSYSSLSSEKQASFGAVYKKINSLNYGSSDSSASVSETFAAFCKHKQSEFSSNQSEDREISTIRDSALKTVESCLSSAQSNVKFDSNFPESPSHDLAVSFSGGNAKPLIEGVKTNFFTCSHKGKVLDEKLNPAIVIGSSAVTITCKRDSRKISISGYDGDYFPASQVIFLTNFSQKPLEIALPEAAEGPLQGRLATIEARLVVPRSVVAFDSNDCPIGWKRYAGADGNTIIGSSPPKYPLRATGGTETHQLTVNEMPSHDHGAATGSGSPAMVHGGGPAAGHFGSGNHPYSQLPHAHTISAQGGNAPHNNMQPYIALTYCEKQ